MLDNNMLALADYNNYNVKIVDVNNNKVISCIKLPTKPRDITRVERDQIVVTCDITLVFIKVGKTLCVLREVDIGGHSRGIVFTNNTFICSFENPGCVKIIKFMLENIENNNNRYQKTDIVWISLLHCTDYRSEHALRIR